MSDIQSSRKSRRIKGHKAWLEEDSSPSTYTVPEIGSRKSRSKSRGNRKSNRNKSSRDDSIDEIRRDLTASKSSGKVYRTLPVLDEAPLRQYHPLLCTGGGSGNKAAYDIAWPLMDLYLPLHVNTYPIAYQARLLGFKVPAENLVPAESYHTWQIDREPWTPPPPLGTYYPRMCDSVAANLPKDSIYDADDVRVLGEGIDPVYTALLRQYTTPNGPLKPANQIKQVQGNSDNFDIVLQQAREWNLLNERATVIILSEAITSSIEKDGKEIVSKLWWNKPSMFGLLLTKDVDQICLGLYYSMEYHIAPYREPDDSGFPVAGEKALIMLIDDIVDGEGSFLERENFEDNCSEILFNVILLISIALYHAYTVQLYYAVVTVPCRYQSFLQTYFRMVPATVTGKFKEKSAVLQDKVTMVCDLHKCSYRYAFLKYLEKQKQQQLQQNFINNNADVMLVDGVNDDGNKREITVEKVHDAEMAVEKTKSRQRSDQIYKKDGGRHDCASEKEFLNLKLTTGAAETKAAFFDLTTESTDEDIFEEIQPIRCIIRLPNVDEAKNALQPPTIDVDQEASILSHAKQQSNRKVSNCFSGGTTASVRNAIVNLRVRIGDDHNLQIHKLLDSEEIPLQLPNFYSSPLIEIFKSFPLPKAQPDEGRGEDVIGNEILETVLEYQKQVEDLEHGVEPTLRILLHKAVEERKKYESAEAAAQREKEKVAMENYKLLLEKRAEIDLHQQQRLEQDMDAVCDVCNDGEVNPDNQILFCEYCNVAVHQLCYGVERVPEGDFYCVACRYLGKDKISILERTDAVPSLPIRCELCPKKQGAYLKTAMYEMKGQETSYGRWVHVVCAKWVGVNFTDRNKAEEVEDVAELKLHTIRNQYKCMLCKGVRGALFECREEKCDHRLHVTCARLSGLCEVVHGENVEGPITENPWTLKCPNHSLKAEANKSEKCLSIEELKSLAMECPPEVEPTITIATFDLTSDDKKLTWSIDEALEKDLLTVLMSKKLYGAKCEACNIFFPDAVHMTKCTDCKVAFCVSCIIENCDVSGTDKCPACKYVYERKLLDETVEDPTCLACNMKSGFLLPAFAIPASRKTWVSKEEQFKKSMFGRKIWIHASCHLWTSDKTVYKIDKKAVSCSEVIMVEGQSLVMAKVPCYLCGDCKGLKVRCRKDNCKLLDDEYEKIYTSFHVSCARQAGFELNTESEGKIPFAIYCYRHGGTNYNFRVKLEDLMEIEKRRAGNNFEHSNTPMEYTHFNNILHAAIDVLNTLAWAWRWAEWWVDYNYHWEPLIEPHEREEDLTNEQLRVVDSTRKSRCNDARKCRLVAFSIALRNRAYDEGNGVGRQAFDVAIRAVLKTQSLSGPLLPREIDFLAESLGLAYRSKFRLLGIGENKIPESDAPFCKNLKGFLKFKLDNQPIPGYKNSYSLDIVDPDNFLHTKYIAKDEFKYIRKFKSPKSTDAKNESNSIIANQNSSIKKKPVEKKNSTNLTTILNKMKPEKLSINDQILDKATPKGVADRTSLRRSSRASKPTKQYVDRVVINSDTKNSESIKKGKANSAIVEINSLLQESRSTAKNLSERTVVEESKGTNDSKIDGHKTANTLLDERSSKMIIKPTNEGNKTNSDAQVLLQKTQKDEIGVNLHDKDKESDGVRTPSRRSSLTWLEKHSINTASSDRSENKRQTSFPTTIEGFKNTDPVSNNLRSTRATRSKFTSCDDKFPKKLNNNKCSEAFTTTISSSPTPRKRKEAPVAKESAVLPAECVEIIDSVGTNEMNIDKTGNVIGKIAKKFKYQEGNALQTPPPFEQLF